MIEAWRKHFNEVRPHSSLGYLRPAAFVAKIGKDCAAPSKATGQSAAVFGVSALRPVAGPLRKEQITTAMEAAFSS